MKPFTVPDLQSHSGSLKMAPLDR